MTGMCPLAAAMAARRARLDAEMNAAGFHGYEGCPHDECPTPYLCSERGDCRAAPVEGEEKP